MNVDYKKTILKTTLWTLLALIVATLILSLVLFLAFPKTLANFCYTLGSEGVAANLYYRDYEKNDDIYSVYRALNIEIKFGNNDKIIKYYENFSEDVEYDSFMESYKSRNESLNIGALEKSSLLNEENYLVNKYISALLATEQNSRAFNLAISLFANYSELTLDNQGVYSFTQFLGKEDFSKTPLNYTKNLKDSIQEYFNLSVALFESKSSTNNTLEKAYLIALGNRIIQVGQDINTIYNNDSEYSDIIENNTNKMLSINEMIKGLI